jgi:phosphodiesterase/alkaline phosphatase D-like protein
MHPTNRQRSAPGHRLRALALALVALGALAGLAAPAAQAALKGATLTAVWGSPIGETGSPYGPSGGGVAVNDATGDVYVVDDANARVVEFDSAGNFLRTWGYGVLDGNEAPEVCTAPSGCQAGLPGSGPGQFESFQGIAVDNSHGPNAGDVYVASGPSLFPEESVRYVVDRFSEDGVYEGQIDGSDSPHGAFQELQFGGAVAVDDGGTLWILDRYIKQADHAANRLSRVMRFSNQPDNAYVPGSEVNFQSNPLALAVNGPGTRFYVADGNGFPIITGHDPDGGNPSVYFGADRLAIDHANGVVYSSDEYSYGNYYRGEGELEAFTATGALIPESEFGAEVASGFSGLAVNSASKVVYVRRASHIYVYTPRYVPDVSTGEVTDLGHTTATLNGEVGPDARGGGDVSECKVEYGLTSAYGASAPCAQATPISGATPVSAEVSGLTVGKTYHYRFSATNANGPSVGQDRTFVAPAVLEAQTEAASEITRVSAVLNGSYLGEGKDTHYYFQWGLTTAYGQTTATPPGLDAGAGSGRVEIAAEIEGLSFYQLYHYRLVATNSFGTSFGPDRSFFTLPPLAPQIGAVSLAEVTPQSATVAATISPGFGPTVVRVQYGPTAAFGSSTLPSESVGEDGGEYPVAQQLTGLSPGSVYHYRFIATNFGATTYGPEGTFATPGSPLVSGSAASAVTATTATLSAQVNPRSAASAYHFEYGTTQAYGASTPAGSLAADAAPHAVSQQIAGLSPATVYHYRLLANNEVGAGAGSDATFTTAPASLASQPTACRKGFVRRHGKCAKAQKKKRHHKRRLKGGQHG